MKYSLQISKNKNLFKRHKYPSPNALNIKHFWTLIKTIGGSWVSLNRLILNFKKTSCPKNVWMQHCTQGHASTTVYSEMTSTRKIFFLKFWYLKQIYLKRRSYHVMNGSQQSLSLLRQNLQHTKIFRLGKNNNNNKQQPMRTQKTKFLQLFNPN